MWFFSNSFIVSFHLSSEPTCAREDHERYKRRNQKPSTEALEMKFVCFFLTHLGSSPIMNIVAPQAPMIPQMAPNTNPSAKAALGLSLVI